MHIDKAVWNKIILKRNDALATKQGCFLQSYEWAAFQESLGRKVWPILLNDRDAVLLIQHSLPLGKAYLYCPRGPALSTDSQQMFLAELEKIAQSEKIIFAKIEPEIQLNLPKAVKSAGVQPQQTMISNLGFTEDRLLGLMHPKTRYNLKLAQKKGVTIEQIENPDQEQQNKFYQLAKQTSQRDGFKIYPQKYYDKMLSFLSQEKMTQLFIARYQQKTIAANIIGFFGTVAYYLHGASDYQYRQLMAPYFLQWVAIRQAQKQGCLFYDFWGYDEKKWPGVSRFKKGFGGQVITYPSAQNLVFDQFWYQTYNLMKRLL